MICCPRCGAEAERLKSTPSGTRYRCPHGGVRFTLDAETSHAEIRDGPGMATDQERKQAEASGSSCPVCRGRAVVVHLGATSDRYRCLRGGARFGLDKATAADDQPPRVTEFAPEQVDHG